MEIKTIVVGVVLGMVIVAGPIGTLAAIDELNGPDAPDASVERVNDTHAAVSWTTEEPGYGHLETYVQPECNSSWIGVDTINDSSFDRMHHVVAPIYELNETTTNRTLTNLSEDHDFEYDGGSPKRFKVVASVYTDGSGASETVLQRNLSGTCQ